ncbi:hypothetical protein CIG2463D_0995 [Campylobacter iguaniorum]|uniref:sce7726 family protein n=1 Tax=Campylobacter iguaniorum TaxID=1244531 RepID=UPI00073A2676|nr:sce7726 family protein [Campylobacter iguaniorum]ALV24568.1 hypothetical protein CIG2463D_0995 [Campylobacter iguaniorum]
MIQIANAKIITKALINWLDCKYKDKTITTEISVNTTFGTKVADVVVSNGHAVAYEIKSELDTTARLESQIKGFSELFDYVYIVYWENKFTIDELKAPNNIGIISAKWNKSKQIEFKIIKKAKINNNITAEKVGNLLWKKELEYFLQDKNIKTKTNYDKCTLVKLFMSNFNKTESMHIFRYILKNRFKKGFLVYRENQLKDNSLELLTKYKVDMNYLEKMCDIDVI